MCGGPTVAFQPLETTTCTVCPRGAEQALCPLWLPCRRQLRLPGKSVNIFPVRANKPVWLPRCLVVRMGEGSLFLGATVRIYWSPGGEPAGRKAVEAGNE